MIKLCNWWSYHKISRSCLQAMQQHTEQQHAKTNSQLHHQLDCKFWKNQFCSKWYCIISALSTLWLWNYWKHTSSSFLMNILYAMVRNRFRVYHGVISWFLSLTNFLFIISHMCSCKTWYCRECWSYKPMRWLMNASH